MPAYTYETPGPLRLSLEIPFGRIELETVEHQLEKGDVILLCSDGLHSMINDEAILKTVTPFPATLPAAAQKLIDAANEAGGKDNVSVVLLRYTE